MLAPLIIALVLLAVLAAACALVGDRLGWPLDLVQHFHPHVLAGLLLLLPVALLGLSGGWRWIAVAACLGATLASATAIAGVLRPAPEAGGAFEARVAHANLWGGNQQHERALAWLRRERPDIVVLTEVTPAWAAALSGLADLYPHRRLDGMGDIAILSVWPWQAIELRDKPPGQLAMARVGTPAGPLTVVGTHPIVPATPELTSKRDRLIHYIASRSAQHDEPLVVLGDFNATPWSRPMRALVRDTSLRYGPGAWVSTWPTRIPRPFGVAIDHILAGNGCRVIERRHGEQIGSDHWPVTARIACRGSTAPAPGEGASP